MSTIYEVRRGAHVETRRDDAKAALAFAEVHSHFPGQLKVYAVERREYLITEAPPEVIPMRGARGLRVGR